MPYTHLTSEERYCIAHMHMHKISIRIIANRLSRSPSSISRELKRNKSPYSVYWYDTAELYSRERRIIPRCQKRKSHQPLYDVVIKGLKNGLSPEIISRRLVREYRSLKMRVSHETIYQWIFDDAKQGGQLYLSMTKHRKKRRKQRRSCQRRLFDGRVSIDERPKLVDDKKRFGDWESDSVEGAKSKGGLATHVERKSRYLVACKLSDKKSETYMNASINALKGIDSRFLKTFTVDNGSEFAKFKKLEDAINVRVFFADPYSPWQRGLNENTNGLLRRYFPKGCNFHDVDDKVLQEVVEKLNHRPRKCLNFRTPYEVLYKSKSVALRI